MRTSIPCRQTRHGEAYVSVVHDVENLVKVSRARASLKLEPIYRP
jgi:hypothetical protein